MSSTISLPERVKAALADERGLAARRKAFGIIRPRVGQLRAQFPDFASGLRRMKLDALGRNAELVAQAIENLKANGFRVYLARENQEAVEYILKLLTGPTLLIKSKSNMGKEIGIVGALEDQGVKVIETDLGDWINQLGGTTGNHLLAPAASVPKSRIRELFSKEVGEELPEDTEVLVQVARRKLRKYMESADYGLSGANAIAADTGTVVLMENEGNIRAVTSLPRVHVVVAGIHKVVPALGDAVQVVRGASVFGAGQLLGNYLSCISGPGDGVNGPAEVHVVLVDGGRSKVAGTGYVEALGCINCGACLNYCPVYAEIGDAYGYKRAGGIGVLTAALLNGAEAAEEAGIGLCIGCGKCVAVCPVQIDTPGLINRLKGEIGAARPGKAARLMYRATGDRARLRRMAAALRFYQKSGLRRLARATGILKPLGLEGAEAMLPDVTPAPAVIPVPKAPERAKVAFFRGCIMDQMLGPINADTLDVLAYNGCRVYCPEGQVCCGALHEHGGDLGSALKLARANVDAFGDGSDPIVTNSAGCGAMLKHYAVLLARDPAYAERARAFSARVRDLSEYLAELGLRPPASSIPIKVTYHDACHLANVQGITEEPRVLLRAIPGVELTEMKAGEFCCGSGGVWSLDHPEIAARLRDEKLEDAAAAGARIIVTANPGCLMHLKGGGAEVVHLAELLARAYRKEPAPAGRTRAELAPAGRAHPDPKGGGRR